MRYAELQCASHFSFLRGASSPDELFAQAEACGLDALAITDRNTLAGIVRAHEAAKLAGVRLIVGCRLDLSERSEEHTSELQSLMRISYAVFCLKKNKYK